MPDSIFTRIIKGEIPCHKVYEDDMTLAFLDIHPVQPGHILVIPKKQIEFLWDLAAEEYDAVMAVAKKLAVHIRDNLSVPYVGLKVIGTDVPHAHIHLIPFTDPSQFHNQPNETSDPDHSALADMAKKLML